MIRKNLIEIGEYVFTDDQILSGEASDAIGLVSEDLPAGQLVFITNGQACAWEELQDADNLDLQDVDELDLVVLSDAADIDMTDIEYGHEVVYTHEGTLIGRYYVQDVRRIGKKAWRITCLDAIGLLTRQKHDGGIYDANTTAATLIADLLGNIPYTIRDAEISVLPVPGYLPIASRRDNLQQLLFAYGISALYDADGYLEFCFNQPDTAKTISEDAIYQGGSVEFLAKATKVRVTEHGYYQSGTDTKVLFQVTGTDPAVTNARIEFDGPYHSLNFGTFTEVARGVNFAVVSGTGTLTGIPYVHTTRELVQTTGLSGEDCEVKVTDATLVTAANSAGVLARVTALYSQAQEVSCAIVSDGEKPGDMIAFTDPFGDIRTGYIKSRKIAMSGKLKAALKVATEWTPGNMGSDWANYFIVDEGDLVGGNVVIPAEYIGKRARAVLIGGSRGGWPGYPGQPGGTVDTAASDRFGWHEDYPDNWAKGGAPGFGGEPGNGVKVLAVDIASLASTYAAVIGDGGLGGTYGDVRTEGQLGDDTTITVSGTTYSTADGTEVSILKNLVDGSIVAEPGSDGTPGARGGDAARTQHSPESTTPAENGGSVTVGGTTFAGGSGGPSSIHPNYKTDGGGGGGACGSSAGEAGSPGDYHYSVEWHTGIRHKVYEGGNGGNGASSTTPPAQASPGRGGTGGFGGGGGGAAGAAAGNGGANETDEHETGDNGKGGSPGPGGKGGKGRILFYVAA
ncbi:MAG: hypothetical protein K5981_09115 [Clostridia bacterium]|nr:hypothetical protein [Clostridia bacterium]